MREAKTFLVPPDLQKKLLIFGMTVPESSIVVALAFFAVNRLTQGQKLFMILPCIAAVLFVRALDSGHNVLHILKIRVKFYLQPQIYKIKGSDHQ